MSYCRMPGCCKCGLHPSDDHSHVTMKCPEAAAKLNAWRTDGKRCWRCPHNPICDNCPVVGEVKRDDDDR